MIEILREAKVGEYVRVIQTGYFIPSFKDKPDYRIGDIIKIAAKEKLNNHIVCYYFKGRLAEGNTVLEKVLLQEEYAVLEDYEPNGLEKDFSYLGVKETVEEKEEKEIKLVHRKAKVGEYVKIIGSDLLVPTTDDEPDYKAGDILQIVEPDLEDFSEKALLCYRYTSRVAYNKDVLGEDGNFKVVYPSEYNVMVGYIPPVEEEEVDFAESMGVINDAQVGDDIFSYGCFGVVVETELFDCYSSILFSEGDTKEILASGYHGVQCRVDGFSEKQTCFYVEREDFRVIDKSKVETSILYDSKTEKTFATISYNGETLKSTSVKRFYKDVPNIGVGIQMAVAKLFQVPGQEPVEVKEKTIKEFTSLELLDELKARVYK